MQGRHKRNGQRLVAKAGLKGPSHLTDLAILSIRPWVELRRENVLRAEASFTADVDSVTLLCSGRA